jgi:hypothetical protein
MGDVCTTPAEGEKVISNRTWQSDVAVGAPVRSED